MSDYTNSNNEKTIVYIDAANIILSCKNVDLRIDILKLIQNLKDKFRTEKIIYFTGNFKSMEKYFDTLIENGVEMIYKEIYNENDKTKANCDVEISHRITYDIENGLVDKVILLSGDGDFVHLADYINRNKKKITVIAAEPISCSRMIKKRQFIALSYLRDFGDGILIGKDEETSDVNK